METVEKQEKPRLTYRLSEMAVGDTMDIPVPTGADVKRIANNASKYGERYERFYRCKTDRKTRIMTITRVR